jgi:glycosyltransferase involved in cell wall biosynthesis
MGKVDLSGISVLVPLHFTDPEWRTGRRAKTWRWLEQYWRSIPGLELVIGDDEGAEREHITFSKSVAVNDAVEKSRGDILAIMDADGFLPIEAIIRCAKEIRLARERGYKLWMMPYRQLFRLTEEASDRMLESNPADPLQIELPPPDGDFINKEMFRWREDPKFAATPVWKIGHWYGAMAQIMPREAFYEVGGWDPRFRGWGGEDHAAMVAMDTLYGPHKTLPGAVMHLWHPIINPENIDPNNKEKRRMWIDQKFPSSNDVLSGRYFWSKNNVARMRRLVSEYKPIEPDPSTDIVLELGVSE